MVQYISVRLKVGYLNVSKTLQLIEITAILRENVSCSQDGIMEWWNVGLNKELIHFIASL